MTPQATNSPTPEGRANNPWYPTAAVMMGCIATVLSSTMVNVAMPDIMGEFGMGQDQVQWISTSFLAAMTACMLLTGWALSTFGKQATYITALIIFVIGSILGGSSSSQGLLILGRVIQGGAAGLIQPVAMVVILTSFEPSKRGASMGIFTLGIVVAPALGPTLGGLLIDNYSWRYIFFVGIPLCILGSFMAMAFMPRQTERGQIYFDLPGFILLCIAISTFLTALSNGQREGWDSVFVLGSFGAGICSGIAFLVREQTCKSPLLALSVYKNPRFCAAALVSFILGMGLFGTTYLIPLFVQTVQGYSPTEAGLLLMPAGLVLGVVSPVAGHSADKIAPYKLIFLGLLLCTWSSLLMTEAETSTYFWSFALWIALGRVGMGLISPSLNTGAVSVLEHSQIAQGAGNLNFMRQLGGAIGVSLLSVYLERKTTLYCQAISAMQQGTVLANNTVDTLNLIYQQAGIASPDKEAAKAFISSMIEAQGRMMGFRESFLLCAIIFGLALVPALLMRRRRKKHVTQSVKEASLPPENNVAIGPAKASHNPA